MARSVVGYVAVPSVKLCGRQLSGSISQAEELELQRGRIRDYARKRRWQLEEIFEGVLEPGEFGRTTIRVSKGLGSALREIEAGHATALVIDRLERISFFTDDVLRLVHWHLDRSAALVAFDDGLDTARRGGLAILNAFAWGADWERRMTGARIRTGRARRRTAAAHRGWPVPEYGGRIADRPELLAYIHQLHDEGLSLLAIAQRLDDEGVPTARGGRYWWPSTVASALRYPRPR
jgi:DNA invertase Pin-like site-specific DNA recombinase